MIWFLLKVIFGVNTDLVKQFPDEDVEDCKLYAMTEWRRSNKGRLLLGVWDFLLPLWVCLLLGGYYAVGAVIFYGQIRWTSIMVNTVIEDYTKRL